MKARSLGLATLLALVTCGVACGSRSPARPTDCSQITVTPSGQSIGSGGGAGTLTVDTPSGCTWYAASPNAWITITAGASGTGPGTVVFTASANLLPEARTGVLMVGGQQVGITQEGTPPPAGCTYELRPTSRVVSAMGAGFLAIVFAPNGCRWAFGGNDAWIQVIAETEGAPNGNGNGSVEVHVAPNTGAAPRSGTAAIAGQTLVVLQDGATTPACTYAVNPPGALFSAAGGAGQVTVQTSPNCTWSVEGEDFIRVSAVRSGSGTLSVPYTVLPNEGFAGRQGEVVIRGDSGFARLVHQVKQAAATCLYSVSPTQASYGWLSSGSGLGHPYVDVSTQPGTCSWTASSTVPWIIVWSWGSNTGSGAGAGRVFYDVLNYTGRGIRTGEVIVSGLSGLNPSAKLVVTQSGWLTTKPAAPPGRAR